MHTSTTRSRSAAEILAGAPILHPGEPSHRSSLGVGSDSGFHPPLRGQPHSAASQS